jgi:hypothetical protein
MFRFFGGVPRLVVPDNLKSGVHKASFYDPEINRSYAMMAAHYGVGILPARPYRPRDKAKVEAGVKFAQTYILGRLRYQTFFSLADANGAIALVLERMKRHVMRRLGLSRGDLFTSVERPVLRALPATDYEFAEWRLARVGLDYHVEVEGFYYSVPHALSDADRLTPTSRASCAPVMPNARRACCEDRRSSDLYLRDESPPPAPKEEIATTMLWCAAAAAAMTSEPVRFRTPVYVDWSSTRPAQSCVRCLTKDIRETGRHGGRPSSPQWANRRHPDPSLPKALYRSRKVSCR